MLSAMQLMVGAILTCTARSAPCSLEAHTDAAIDHTPFSAGDGDVPARGDRGVQWCRLSVW